MSLRELKNKIIRAYYELLGSHIGILSKRYIGMRVRLERLIEKMGIVRLRGLGRGMGYVTFTKVLIEFI